MIQGKKQRYIIGYDNGAANIKVSILDLKTNERKNYVSSSIIATAPDDATDMILYKKQRYYTGVEALYAKSESQIDIIGYDSLSIMSPIALYAFLKQENIHPDEVAFITIGLSFAHYAHASEFKKLLTKFKINNEVIDFTGRLSMIPQGVGAKISIEELYEKKGLKIPHAYLIIDLGFLTRDDVDVINGTVRKENVNAEEHGGVIRVARNIQEYVMRKLGFDISIKEAKEALDNGEYFASGEVYPLDKVIPDFLKEYTKYVMSQVESKHVREFLKYRKIFFVGGGAHFIEPDRQNIEIIEEPEFANSIGNCIKAAADYKKKLAEETA